MILSIDFDGTLHLGIFPEIGVIAPYAKWAMKTLHDDGHYLIINTCRSGDSLLEAINWLLEQGIIFDRVNDNHPGNIAEYRGNTRKIYADMYIDDKQVGGLPTWPEILDAIIKINEEKLCGKF